MKSTARRLVLTALHHSGVLWLWRWWRRNAIIILTVHGVEDDSAAGLNGVPCGAGFP